MSKILVPLGVDCGLTQWLKDAGLRNFSLPFDWTVSYNGVSDIIDNEFIDYIPHETNKFNTLDIGNNGQLNKYDVRFIHHNFPNDNEKINRKISRFLNLLQSDNEIIFLRKGHSEHHHDECNNLTDEFLDCQKLYDILKLKYKNLKFKIILFLVCSKCYNNKTYETSNVIVYNISNLDGGVFGVNREERLNLVRNLYSDFEKQAELKKNLLESFQINF